MPSARHIEEDLLDYRLPFRRAAVELSLIAERERREIAGEVHDNIGQELAIAKLRLSQLCTEEHGERLRVLEEIRDRIAAALESCRLLTHDLATPSLYKLGLAPAIRNLVAEFARAHELDISTDFAEANVALPTSTEIILYRAIKELLVNVVKHAEARNVHIDLTMKSDCVTFAVRDDGIGFDPGVEIRAPETGSGLGLLLMRERLHYLGGSFELQSAPGAGTKVTLIIPVQAKNDVEEQRE